MVVLMNVLIKLVGIFVLIITVVVREDKDGTYFTAGIHKAVVEVSVAMDGDLEAAVAKQNIELVFRHNGIAAVVRED